MHAHRLKPYYAGLKRPEPDFSVPDDNFSPDMEGELALQSAFQSEDVIGIVQDLIDATENPPPAARKIEHNIAPDVAHFMLPLFDDLHNIWRTYCAARDTEALDSIRPVVLASVTRIFLGSPGSRWILSERDRLHWRLAINYHATDTRLPRFLAYVLYHFNTIFADIIEQIPIYYNPDGSVRPSHTK